MSQRNPRKKRKSSASRSGLTPVYPQLQCAHHSLCLTQANGVLHPVGPLYPFPPHCCHCDCNAPPPPPDPCVGVDGGGTHTVVQLGTVTGGDGGGGGGGCTLPTPPRLAATPSKNPLPPENTCDISHTMTPPKLANRLLYAITSASRAGAT